jgi:hypothetical protein
LTTSGSSIKIVTEKIEGSEDPIFPEYAHKVSHMFTHTIKAWINDMENTCGQLFPDPRRAAAPDHTLSRIHPDPFPCLMII